MQKFVSFQEKFNNVIDFVSELMTTNPYFENDEPLVDENDHKHKASMGTPIEANSFEEHAFEKCKTSKYAEAKESVKEYSSVVI